MNSYNKKEFNLYKKFVDAVCKFNNGEIPLTISPVYRPIFDTWYDLYNTNNILALKALFYLCSQECPFRNEDIFSKLLEHLSDTEPERCKAIINNGLIEKYASISNLFNLLGCEDDDIDRCVIDHLTGLILTKTFRSGVSDILFLYDIRYRIAHNENALRYFEKYYDIKPEFWSTQIIETNGFRESKYDVLPLDEYKIDFLINNCAG